MSILTTPRLVVTVPLPDTAPSSQAAAFIATTPGPVLTDLTEMARGWLADCFPAEAEVIMDEDDTTTADVWTAVASQHATGIDGFVRGEGYRTIDADADDDDRADMIESSALDLADLLTHLLAA